MKNVKRIISIVFVLALLASCTFTSTNALVAPLVKGDVDTAYEAGGSQINIKDATAIQKYLAGLTVFSKQQIYCADTNFDNKITIQDATLIQKLVADIIEKLPYPDDFHNVHDYIIARCLYADYDSGKAMVGVPVTFYANGVGTNHIRYEYKINGEVVRPADENNSFTTTFDEAGTYNISVTMYNRFDTTATHSMEYTVLPAYTSDTLMLRALYYDRNCDWSYTDEFTATALAFMGSGEYEYEFLFDGETVQPWGESNQYSRDCNPHKEDYLHTLTVRIRDKQNPEYIIEENMEIIFSEAIG